MIRAGTWDVPAPERRFRPSRLTNVAADKHFSVARGARNC